MPPARKNVMMAQAVAFKDPNDPKQLLIELNLEDEARPAVIKIYKCTLDQLVSLGEACLAAAEVVRKHQK